MQNEIKTYIQTMKSQGHDVSAIAGALVAAGWSEHEAVGVVDQHYHNDQRTTQESTEGPAMQQSAAGDGLSVQPSGSTERPAKYVTGKPANTGFKRLLLGAGTLKPPVPAQVLYAISFICLLLVIAWATSVIASISSDSSGLSSGIIRVAGLTNFLVITAILCIVGMMSALFWLVIKIRSGSFWALVSFSTLITWATSLALFDYIYSVSLFTGKRDSDTLVSVVLLTVLAGVPLVLLLKSHRAYFK